LKELLKLPIDSILEPEEVIRTQIDQEKLEELAASIRQIGLIQPILVKKDGELYRIIAGHRRYLACRWNNAKDIDCYITDEEITEDEIVSLSENIIRHDLNPVEEAKTCRVLNERLGLSIQEISNKLGKSQSWVRERLSVLNFPESFISTLATGLLSLSALKPLLEIEDENERERLLAIAIEQGATARLTEAWVLQWKKDKLAQGWQSVEPIPPGGIVEIPVVEYPCYFCRESKPIYDEVLLYVCKQCKAQVDIELAKQGG